MFVLSKTLPLRPFCKPNCRKIVKLIVHRNANTTIQKYNVTFFLKISRDKSELDPF